MLGNAMGSFVGLSRVTDESFVYTSPRGRRRNPPISSIGETINLLLVLGFCVSANKQSPGQWHRTSPYEGAHFPISCASEAVSTEVLERHVRPWRQSRAWI